MLAEKEPGQGNSGPDGQSGVRSKDVPFRGNLRESHYVTVLTESLTRAHELCQEAEKNGGGKLDHCDNYWYGYWAGQRCAIQHSLDLLYALNSDKVTN